MARYLLNPGQALKFSICLRRPGTFSFNTHHTLTITIGHSITDDNQSPTSNGDNHPRKLYVALITFKAPMEGSLSVAARDKEHAMEIVAKAFKNRDDAEVIDLYEFKDVIQPPPPIEIIRNTRDSDVVDAEFEEIIQEATAAKVIN